MKMLDTVFQKVLRSIPISSNVKYSNLSDTGLSEMVKNCRNEIIKSNESGIMPSPKYFEQVAVLSRKEKRYEDEVAICEMYIDIAEQYAVEHNLSESETIECVKLNCEPLYKRMHYAKAMIVNNNS